LNFDWEGGSIALFTPVPIFNRVISTKAKIEWITKPQDLLVVTGWGLNGHAVLSMVKRFGDFGVNVVFVKLRNPFL